MLLAAESDLSDLLLFKLGVLLDSSMDRKSTPPGGVHPVVRMVWQIQHKPFKPQIVLLLGMRYPSPVTLPS